ncbi:MAG TPA: putative Ig domain-containing protein, partial [Jatrophihabitans sp.]|nr:putative Ig domain-containing protein [Jatrophihabitans sp.]
MSVFRAPATRPGPVRAGLALTLAVALVGLGQLALHPSRAAAATPLNVTTVSDIGATAGACGNTGITTPPSPLSLREAICIANNLGGAQTVNVPAGHYVLSGGDLLTGLNSGQNITITGAGSATTVIDANHASRVFNVDSNSVGGITVSISGVTVTNGVASSIGGGGILAGSASASTADSLTISNSVISNNESDYGTPTDTGQPGGGLQFEGGSLTLNNVTVSGNKSHSSWGSGVEYRAGGFASPESLTISNSTLSGNSADNSGSGGSSGGALYASGTGVSESITNSVFTGNSVNSTSGEHAAGAAIYVASGNLTVTGSTFTGNTLSASGSGVIDGGAAIYTTTGAALHYDRITGNTGQAVTTAGSGTADVGDNWWGCNTGPNTTGCDTTGGSGFSNATSYLKLVASAAPSHVVGPNGTATITASLTTDSLGATVGGSNLTGAFDTLPVTFADPPGDATVAASSAALSSGQASVGYNSHTTLGPDNDSVTLDNATVSAVIEVDEAPAITSANTATFNIGSPGSFTVTTSGYPSAALTESGTLPTGLAFTDNGNGTATLAGTATGSGGSYPITITANNGYSPNATQTLTISVGQPPAFTSASTATFTIGTPGSFTVTTSGIPMVSTITESGTLPAGVTFADNGDGTATIAGTPSGTGNTYPVTLTATNGVSPNATQNLTVQVNQAPAVTLNPTDQTVQPSTSVTFTAAASGVPTPTVQWQVSTDGGTSFSNVAGATTTSYTHTATLGEDGNQYRAVFSNVAGSATTTAATLNVGTAPSFTSADNTRFQVGVAGSFAITTTGMPSASLSRSGAQFPVWLTLTDNGDGTGSLTGTPPAGSAGQYVFTLKAANGFSPTASQTFTLFVDASPVITSADHTTFTSGQAGSFAVTTTAGSPTTTAITETGALPAGVSFTDNGDGTASLAGTPAAGSGGSYPLTLTATATGGIAPAATQSFTLTVLAPPAITSANHTTFAAGTAGTFTVTT